MDSSRVEVPWPQDHGRHKVVLTKGQWMRHPTSTKRRLHGPMVLDWYVLPDGDDVTILEGEDR